MGGKLKGLAAIVGVVASIWIGGPAGAAPVCVGTAQTTGVCVEVGPGSPTYQDCIYVGPPPCIPVTVPGFDIECGGWIRDQWWLQCA